jgi:hypothetical protein
VPARLGYADVRNHLSTENLRLKPLEFDGREDSIYHPFDIDGQRHMEYLNFRGSYADLPFEEISRDVAKYYPLRHGAGMGADFEREVVLETSA